MTNIQQVDFEIVAKKTGYKYGKNARSVFKKLWDKLKASSNAGSDAATEAGLTDGAPTYSADGETTVNEPEDKPKSKARATPKKAVKKETTPRKASAGGPKAPRGRKKSAAKSEETIPAEAASANDASMLGANELTQGSEDALSAEILGVSVQEYRKSVQGDKMEVGYHAEDEGGDEA
jgi:hypothetical protein